MLVDMCIFRFVNGGGGATVFKCPLSEGKKDILKATEEASLTNMTTTFVTENRSATSLPQVNPTQGDFSQANCLPEATY